MTLDELIEDPEIGGMVEEIEWMAWLMKVWGEKGWERLPS